MKKIEDRIDEVLFVFQYPDPTDPKLNIWINNLRFLKVKIQQVKNHLDNNSWAWMDDLNFWKIN